ncbi:SMI1/KNR4 family protein [Paenibacillus chitinolyticus]|uniref:SMI1/KNR4 family protein n=1 Tax=Paenibacillus chitinolyticus TaxID=79263 RepID=UPI003D060DB7
MNPAEQVRQAIESLKKLMTNTNGVTVFTVSNELASVCCEFNPPLPTHKYQNFFKENNWYLPDDYFMFLHHCNGATLFKSPHSGGGTRVLTLDEIENIHKDYPLPTHWYPIAWTDLIAGSICIDSERCSKGIYPYLFFLDAIEKSDHAIPLHYNFATWLTRLIVTQGAEYWLWDFHDRINFKNKT